MATEVKILRSLDDEFAARSLRDAGAALISCAANPLDLRPAVDGIMARIEAVSAGLRAGQKLVVLVGETHFLASHRMLQAQLIARLHEKELSGKGNSFAVGVELPHNFMALKLSDMKLSSLSPAVQRHFDRHMGSAGLISAFLDDNPLIAAPQSKSFLLNTIGARGISLRFHDVAVRYETQDSIGGVPCLDDRDDATRALIETSDTSDMPEGHIFCGDFPGMNLRNKFMAENVAAHMKAIDADVYIHMAGSAHLLGDCSEGVSYEKSLHNLLTAEGHAVLSVLPIEGGPFGMNHWWSSMLSDTARDSGLPDTIVVTDMARKRLISGDADEERQMIKNILTQSNAHDIARPAQQKDWKRQLTRFKTDLPHWIDEAKKSYRRELLTHSVTPCVK